MLKLGCESVAVTQNYLADVRKPRGAGTFSTIYGVDPETRSSSLQEALRHDLIPTGAAAIVVFFCRPPIR